MATITREELKAEYPMDSLAFVEWVDEREGWRIGYQVDDEYKFNQLTKARDERIEELMNELYNDVDLYEEYITEMLESE